MPNFWRGRCRAAAVLLSCASALACANATLAQQSPRDFYAGPGKQMRIVVRTTVGGDYDLLSRVLARHMEPFGGG